MQEQTLICKQVCVYTEAIFYDKDYRDRIIFYVQSQW